MVEYNLTGLGSSWRVPGFYTEVNFGAGDASGSGLTHRAIVIACKSSSGSATVETIYGPDTQVSFSSEAEAKTLFGAGSPAHLACKRFFALNNTSPLYVICPTASGVAASSTLTVSGASAAAPGYVRFYRDRFDFVDSSFATGDGYAAISSGLASQINSKDYWPFTASAAASGAITLTAKVAGAEGNTIRFKAAVFGNSTSISVSPTSSTAFTSGSGTISYTNVLAAIQSELFYYIVSENTDQTALAAIAAQVTAQALPINGRRQRLIGASVDTLTNATTIAQALNNPRAELFHLYQADWLPVEMLGHWLANIMLQEEKLGSDGIAFNQSLYGNSPQTSGLWYLPAPLSGTAPSNTQENSGINAGITGCRVFATTGKTIVLDRVTTHTLNGSNPDFRSAETGMVLTCDRFADDLLAKFAARFSNKIISADLDEDARQPVGVVQPRQVKACVAELVCKYRDDGLLRDVANILAGTLVGPSDSNPNRMGVVVPLFVARALKQLTARIDQN